MGNAGSEAGSARSGNQVEQGRGAADFAVRSRGICETRQIAVETPPVPAIRGITPSIV